MFLMVAAALALAGPARPAELVQLAATPGPQVPMALYGSASPAWKEALKNHWESLRGTYEDGAPAVVNVLAAELADPARFAQLGEKEQKEALLAAGIEAQTLATQELDALSARAPDALSAGRLFMLQGPLLRLLPADHSAKAGGAYEAARQALAESERLKVEKVLHEAQGGLFVGPDAPEVTPLEALAAQMPQPPASVMTPRVAALRARLSPAPAWDHSLARPAPKPVPRPILLRAKIRYLRAGFSLRRSVSRRLYRPGRDFFRWVAGHAGEIWRKYVSGREVDKHNFRFGVIERLHKEGDFRGSFGHPVYDGMPEVMSPLIYPEAAAARIRAQKRTIGRDAWIGGELVAVKPLEVSAMMGVSGMSFPQLSAQSHLSLLYINLKLAKDLAIRILENTGEGSPDLHLGLLEGDRSRVERFIVDWGLANGKFKSGSWKEGQVLLLVDELMKARDALFKEFTPDDLRRAQIVAQFGSALNGVRGEENRIDFDKVRAVGESPFVSMIQFKLKQAAKRGAKVDPRKVDEIAAAFRDLPPGKSFKSPEVNPDFSSYEDIAALLLATKAVTRKPVSLKFGVGDVGELLDFLTFLRDANALPDHIQIDGRGDDFSPGSGNAPPGANTSLPSNEAIIAVDAALKKLGARDRVFLEATGDIFLPADGVEKLALGADGLSGARVWMAMGLGCAKVKACANGNCPYGIASKGDSLVGFSLDPLKVAPKGYLAASNWFRAYTQTLAEARLKDWTQARQQLGLHSGSTALRVKQGQKMWTLDRVYDLDYVANVLRGALTADEAKSLVFGQQ